MLLLRDFGQGGSDAGGRGASVATKSSFRLKRWLWKRQLQRRGLRRRQLRSRLLRRRQFESSDRVAIARRGRKEEAWNANDWSKAKVTCGDQLRRYMLPEVDEEIVTLRLSVTLGLRRRKPMTDHADGLTLYSP